MLLDSCLMWLLDFYQVDFTFDIVLNDVKKSLLDSQNPTNNTRRGGKQMSVLYCW